MSGKGRFINRYMNFVCLMTFGAIKTYPRNSMAVHIGQYDVEGKYPALMKGYNEIMKMPEWASVHQKMMNTLTDRPNRKM